ncbi:DUF6603 domain-containing protein [Rhizobacter sp. Root404]|uniref:DUF6603 domain-containing protein n=1 Tax=Rhizobacter sp. Root404 TaxID=1736528 RepID=UPI000AE4D8E5|nr:DUF6603 domain-containing protein [Rhizobacter sp. Root404]
MAGTADTVFLRAFKWFQVSVEHLHGQIPVAALADPLRDALKTRLGLELDKTAAQIDPSAFAVAHAAAESLAVATLVTGETLAALRTLGAVLANLGNGNVDLNDLVAVVRQIERIIGADPGKPPSAYSIAKLLLIVSGDADEPDGPLPARRLVYIMKGEDPAGHASDASVAEPQAIVGLAIMAIGTIIDRAFGNDPAAPRGLPASRAPITLPAGSKTKTFELVRSAGKKLELTFGYDGPAAPNPAVLYAKLNSSLEADQGVGDDFKLAFTAGSALTMAFDLPALNPLPASIPAPRFDGEIDLGLRFGRKSTATPLILGKADGTHFSIGELSGAIVLKNLAPQVEFDLKDSKLVLKVGDDPFLGAVIGDEIEVALTFGLIADIAGGLRLKDGTGLKATIPLEKIPNSPVQIPFLTFELKKAEGLNKIEVELSGSFQVQIGPFAGSIDRLGTKLNLKNLTQGIADAAWGLKPPSGAGMSIDAGVVKGGGFLLFDPDRGEYGGIIDVKIMQIGVKAIGLLSTKNPGGWSLLLIIVAQLPPIQLGFGFTLTGLGGLLGIQHTVNREALTAGLATGSLDNFLFPQNPIANAPQIISQLRVLFPFKAGGFVIGPMLELGWGTPSLVTARVGVLIEPSQLILVGQVIVQLPPLVDKDLALLYLQIDFAGYVVFDPFQIGLDGVLRDSRVLMISLSGQFAFRAVFGDRPSFLISAGGFHPKFTDIPPDVPSPFQRVGADLSIGIVGMQFRGYFAVTSATVQGGSSMRVWGDVGVASFEGGFEFNAIIYLVPTFRFETDIHVFAGIEVFGIDFASVDIYGMLSGPGRWHIVGRAKVHTPWPLPDFSFHVDETWGEDKETVVRRIALLGELKQEIATMGNWSAQLAQAGDSFASFAKLPAPPEGQPAPLLAHPNAVLQFVQKRMPLDKQLDKLGSDKIDGERTIGIGSLVFGASEKAADKVLQDSFPAAQFLDMNEDDLLGKPSFDRFNSGLQVGQRDYLFGHAEGELFDYEEVNLSIEKSGSVLAGAGLTLAQHRHWALDNGAAARTPLRRKDQLRPEDDVRIVINPVPMQVLDTSTGTMAATALAGTAGHSYWHAADAAAAMGGAAQVVEAFESVF